MNELPMLPNQKASDEVHDSFMLAAAEEHARNEAKREKNSRADLRRRSKRRSIINWGTLRVAGHPVNYSAENRGIDKHNELVADARRIMEGGVTTKSKRRRIEKARGNGGKAVKPLNMIAVGMSRADRRARASDIRKGRFGGAFSEIKDY